MRTRPGAWNLGGWQPVRSGPRRRLPARRWTGGLVLGFRRREFTFDAVDEVEQFARLPGAVPLCERDRVEDALVGQDRDRLVHSLLQAAEDLLRSRDSDDGVRWQLDDERLGTGVAARSASTLSPLLLKLDDPRREFARLGRG